MKLTFSVVYEDGRKVESVAKPKDIVAFERQYGQSIASLDLDNCHMEWLYYLAWSPLHRQGRDTQAFDAFLDSVDEISAKEEEEAPAPFLPAASDGTSPDSPSEPE